MSSLGTMSRLNTNVQSMHARRSLNRINRKLTGTQQKLSTGKKINRAEDNAAGLSIATKLDSRVAGLQQSLHNIGDAKSVLGIADRSYQESADLLVDLKKLTTQAASETVSGTEREYIGEKITALTNQINDIANQSVYQGTELLNGKIDPDTGQPKYIQERSLTFQTGERKEDVTHVDLKAVSMNELFPERVRDNGELLPDMKYRVDEIQITVGTSTTSIPVDPPLEQSLLSSSFEGSADFATLVDESGVTGVFADKNSEGITFTNENDEPVEITYFDSRDSLPVESTISLGTQEDGTDGSHEKTVNMGSHKKEWPINTVSILNKDHGEFEEYDIGSYTVKNLTELFHEELNMDHIRIKEESGEINLENTHLYDEEIIKLRVEDPDNGDLIAESVEQAIPVAVIPENVQGEIDTSGWPPSEYRIFSREIDDAITRMADRINTLGATQHSLSSLEQVAVQSVTSNEAARSRIMDTDFAKARSESVRLQILQQTAGASLAQANNGPQSVLGFIG